MAYFKSDKIIEKPIENYIAVLDVDSEQCYKLEDVAKFIWENIENNEFENILQLVSKEFSCDKESIRGDIEEFIEQLLEKKLIVEL
ncbi:Coenzyme PQQ synthesis protein D (PqqD) [Caloranaerobacter azorensis DSM 13643]|uniref:Coenzyme PQQ synthesis protein D (PqqD) n=1 Tax=Caloranaerobacter azorensis DSM 13643 TaxID=1121264 RepID=A0A1M5S185_9FIRM|nr:PqqD family protein [Caloranaerobacter azorensis]SHH32357.1 Coenzyme PQQ synthesis protein D (PqqD) [Caloranaerobacter azorensis DSM 13643]